MKLKIVLILFFLFSSLSIPQEKYFIYFVDKDVKAQTPLQKNSQIFNSVISTLSEKSILRRAKHIENIISYEDLPVKNEYLQSLAEIGVQIKHKLNWFNCVSAYIPKEKFNDVMSLPFVEKIELVKSLSFKKPFEIFIQNNRLNNYGSSYLQLNLSDIPLVHNKGIIGQNVLVGLLDTGFDWKFHEALKNSSVIAEYDFINLDSITANQQGDPPGQDSHGTYVFSIIAGNKDSILIGSAFGSSFLLAKTENIASETNVEEDDYAAAIIWMENQGVDITSSSLGYSEFDVGSRSYTYQDMNGKTTIVARALDLAFNRGVTTFTSAGNEGDNPWRYIVSPADAFNVISVGAVNYLNQLASFSSRGPTSDGRIKPEVIAMGVSVFGAISGTINQYYYASGTSAAAPIAAGVGALLLSKFPHLKNYQIRNIILESSSNSSSPNNQIGYGLISAKNAIEFPNLELNNNNYYLNKVFFDENKINSSTRLHLSINNSDFKEYSYNAYSNDTYQFILPEMNLGDEIKFYFTYQDSTGNIKRNPQTKNYGFEYGSLYINLNIEKPISKFTRISEIYPNPFRPSEHYLTRIKFKSLGNENVRVNIFDAIGNYVKEISFISSLGENVIEWNGISEQGFLSASGVYYFLITINEENFGKKLILVK